MMKLGKGIFPLVVFVTFGGCETLPTGPGVMVLPPANKLFEERWPVSFQF